MRSDIVSTVTPTEFYDQRHARGWMDEWPNAKTERVVELIRDLQLDRSAAVLEFGCGVGVFAAAVKSAEPGFDVHGCDISPLAIAKARRRCPDVTFHVLSSEDCGSGEGTYDLVFTHHVLEHVQDLPATIARIAALLKHGGQLLHVFPCSSEGSLECRIAKMIRGGTLENGLLWIDDWSHVRRLTSAELEHVSRLCGLRPRMAYYANQFWGSIEYLTDTYHGTLLEWFRTLRGRTVWASARLYCVLTGMTALSLLRKLPPHVLSTRRHSRRGLKRVLYSVALPFAAFTYPLSRIIDFALCSARDYEWRHNRTKRGGSEAYVVFEKG